MGLKKLVSFQALKALSLLLILSSFDLLSAEFQFKDLVIVNKTPVETRMLAQLQVMSNHARIKPSKARLIVASAYKASVKYDIPLSIILAIAYVESGYRLDAVNKSSNDFGIMQVNAWHIRKSKLSKQRLLTDLDYSFEHGVRIFSWFYRKYPLDFAIKRYNCGTAKNCVKWNRVKHYLTKVKKAL